MSQAPRTLLAYMRKSALLCDFYLQFVGVCLWKSHIFFERFWQLRSLCTYLVSGKIIQLELDVTNTLILCILLLFLLTDQEKSEIKEKVFYTIWIAESSGEWAMLISRGKAIQTEEIKNFINLDKRAQGMFDKWHRNLGDGRGENKTKTCKWLHPMGT